MCRGDESAQAQLASLPGANELVMNQLGVRIGAEDTLAALYEDNMAQMQAGRQGACVCVRAVAAPCLCQYLDSGSMRAGGGSPRAVLEPHCMLSPTTPSLTSTTAI